MLRTAQLLPQRALDTGLRPGPFPTRAASLLPGLLTATRTGLTPASDDEHEPANHLVIRSPPVLQDAPRIEAKECIGWAIADHMRTDLVCDALDMAARNYELAEDCIFHSDRGTQYMSEQFAKHAAALNIRRSVGRTGICYDNALAESFNAAVKVERVNRTQYPTPEHARRDVVQYIEFRYNRRRLHSALGYRTPQEAYEDYYNKQIRLIAA